MRVETGAVLAVVEGVRVEYGQLVAVRDLSFSLRGGDLLGLVGPNGAGKTTLLRAMAGLQSLSRGRVDVMGRPVVPGAQHTLGQIGFTPDTPAVYEELTVRDFLRFVAKGYGLEAGTTDERIDFWLEQVWLTEKADQKIKSLSRGMRQRIGIGRTLLPNPTVVLMDEPAAGLDPAGRVQFRQLLCSLRDQGKAMVISSHILADLNEYCTHIGIMGQGELVEFGSVSSVVSGGDGSRCRYTVLLSRPMTETAMDLGAIDEVTEVSVDGDRVELEYSSRREDAARLLAAMVGRGIPVASFTAHRPDLEEAYLRAGIRQVE